MQGRNEGPRIKYKLTLRRSDHFCLFSGNDINAGRRPTSKKLKETSAGYEWFNGVSWTLTSRSKPLIHWKVRTSREKAQEAFSCGLIMVSAKECDSHDLVVVIISGLKPPDSQ